MEEKRCRKQSFNDFVHSLQKLRLPMWYGLNVVGGIVIYLTYWLFYQEHIYFLKDWQLAVIPPIYLALIPVLKMAVEHSEKMVERDHE